MIVLTIDEKDWLMNFLQTEGFANQMLAEGLAVIPVEFKNGWMLPMEVLEDPRCMAAKQKLIDVGELKNMTVREVSPDEFFEHDIL